MEKAAYDAKLAEEAIARGEEPAAPTKKRARKTDAAATEKNNSAMLTDAAATITKAKKDKVSLVSRFLSRSSHPLTSARR